MFNRRYVARPPEKIAWPLSRNLLGHWPLLNLNRNYDTTRRDYTPLQNTTLGELRTDATGQSYFFDGVGGGTAREKVLETGAVFQDFASGSFSCSVWARYGTSFGTNFPGLVTKNLASAAGNGWGIAIRTDGTVGRPYTEIRDGTNTATATWATAKNDDKWHLIVLTVDRTTNLLGVWVDLDDAVTASIAAVGSIANSGTFKAGCRPDNLGLYRNKYVGNLRDIRLWKDRALVKDEIRALYYEKDASWPPRSLRASAVGTAQTFVSVF